MQKKNKTEATLKIPPRNDINGLKTLIEKISFRVINNNFSVGIVAILLVITILTASIAYNVHSGILFSTEAYKYLAHYLGPGNVAEKIFDFRGNDNLQGNYYRPRDIGNIFNYLDAELVLVNLKYGIPGLISSFHYGSLMLISVLHLYFSNKYFGKTVFFISFLFLIIYLTSPGVFLTGVYVRSSKSVVSVFIILFIWFFVGIKKKIIQSVIPTSLVIFLLGLLMALTDEVGIAFLFGFFLVSLYLSYILKYRTFIRITISLLCSLLFTVLYRYKIGPLLVYQSTGIWPIVWGAQFTDLSLYSFYRVIDSVGTFIDYLRLLFGNIEKVNAIILYNIFFLYLYLIDIPKNQNSKPGFFSSWSFLYLFGTFIVIGSITLMALTHPPILDLPWKMRYYVIPFHTLFFTVACLITIQITRKMQNIYVVCIVLLCSIVILNITALPEYFKISKAQAYDLQWENTRDITDYLYTYKKLSVINPDSHPTRLKAIEVIRLRLGIKRP